MANGYISSLPLPFGIGVQPVEQVGKGGGPLPFMVGLVASTTRGGAGRGKKRQFVRDDFIAREDEEIIMILIALLEGLD